ncbi:hypothetical protein, variant [Fonticula alba]|uniref:Uncharacterized protein n=1 Tax=Fonticula alba TaxID=691883 RepID=A0A058Z4F9_FONAL|nr:hypothetical protein, variant [Fonticula alba]KCV69174.1 hypothetical protein, variant [Fonticula alba]|eukprot:XP_009496745.1 hypothetical protein, variant [Fonticula alba]
MPRARLFPPGPGLPGAHAGHGGPSARRLRIRTSIWLRNNRRLLRLTIGVMAILAFVAALRLRGAGRSPLGRPMPSPPGMAPAPRVSAPEAPPPGRAPVEPVSSAGTRHLTYILHSLSTQCSAAVARCSDALGVLLFSDPSQPILVPAPAPDFLQNQVPGWAAAAHYTDIALRRLAEWPDLGALAAGVAGGSGLRPAEVRVWTSWQQEFRPQTHVLLDLAPVAAAGGGGGAAAAARPDWRLRMELSDDMLHGPQVIEVSEEWTEATPGSGPLGPAPSRVETLWQRSSVGGPAFRSRPVGFRLVLAPSPVRPGAGLAAGLPLAAELAHSLGRLLAAVPSSPECGPVLCPRPVLSMADLHECFQADNEAAVFHAANCLAIIIDSSILHQLPGDLFDRAADWTRHGRRFYLPVGRSMALSRAEQAGRRRQEAEQPTSPVLCPPGDIAPCPHTLLLRTRERLTLPLLAVCAFAREHAHVSRLRAVTDRPLPCRCFATSGRPTWGQVFPRSKPPPPPARSPGPPGPRRQPPGRLARGGVPGPVPAGDRPAHCSPGGAAAPPGGPAAHRAGGHRPGGRPAVGPLPPGRPVASRRPGRPGHGPAFGRHTATLALSPGAPAPGLPTGELLQHRRHRRLC